MDTESLKYLSVDQSLADYAHFISTIKKNYKYTHSSVFVVGASYSASIAIWMRQKYPHLVKGAWASSGPVLAQFDFKEYKEIMAQSFALVGGEECIEAMQAGFALTEELIETGQFQRLRQLFNLCDDFDPADKFNVWNFMYEISEVFANVVQGHRLITYFYTLVKILHLCDKRCLFFRPGSIESVCKAILPSNRTNTQIALSSFASYVARSFRLVSNEKCLKGNYADSLEDLMNTNYTTQYLRQWFYQSCSEFGWFQTSTSGDHPFGSSFPIHLFTRLCADLFGKKYVNCTNILHT